MNYWVLVQLEPNPIDGGCFGYYKNSGVQLNIINFCYKGIL